ncbi:MAG: beta-RFAP synthase [Planctomycetes bacterium]|nr:beta-RFAP synthase [Planctomycetota bacterium]
MPPAPYIPTAANLPHPTDVTVTTGARLHFGMFSVGQPDIRAYGGVGMMIDRPGFSIRVREVERSTRLCGRWDKRVAMILERLRAERWLGPLSVELLASPEAHSGLGSGTQLGMALAHAVSKLSGEEAPAPEELARRAGRGLRSALGLHGYAVGGLLVEAGHRQSDEISPLISRVTVPADWRCLLIRPRDAVGISGSTETQGFASLAPMPTTTTDRLCRLALLELVPAVMENDFDNACRAIREFGQLVGAYFAPVQGGVFASPQIRRLEAELIARNVTGYGQSSWGPTLFVLCPHTDAAADLARDLAATTDGQNCEYTIASPLNQGAQIRAN